jgi:hypothetical protein
VDAFDVMVPRNVKFSQRRHGKETRQHL